MGFIQITDTHFVPGDELLYDMSPKQRLGQGIAQINCNHADAEFVLVTGDLAHYGQLEAYETLRDTLSELDRPVHLMMGNHDSRAPFLKVFPDTPTIDGGFIQFTLDFDGGRVICLDTLNDVPGDHIGRMCETRLRWLADEIAATPSDTMMVVAGHHHFFDLGMPNMDDIKLSDSAALWEVLEARKPDMYLFGHVHRPISGVYRGIPFHTLRAFNHQVALEFNRTPTLMFTEETPDMAVIHNIDGGLAVFTRSVGGEIRAFPA